MKISIDSWILLHIIVFSDHLYCATLSSNYIVCFQHVIIPLISVDSYLSIPAAFLFSFTRSVLPCPNAFQPHSKHCLELTMFVSLFVLFSLFVPMVKHLHRLDGHFNLVWYIGASSLKSSWRQVLLEKRGSGI